MEPIRFKGDVVIVTDRTHDFDLLRALWNKGARLGKFHCGYKNLESAPVKIIDLCKVAMKHSNKIEVKCFDPNGKDYWSEQGWKNIKRMYLSAFSEFQEHVVVIYLLPEKKAFELLDTLKYHGERKFPYPINIDLISSPKNLAEIINEH